MDRRTFLGWVGVGWIASSLPIAIAACTSGTIQPQGQDNNSSTKEQTPVARADGFGVVGTVTQLNQKGQILNKAFPAGPVLVIRHPTSASQLIALNPTCTHQGCTVDPNPRSRQFSCPCHGSKFGLDGQVVNGPANRPLKTYQVKIEADAVLVK